MSLQKICARSFLKQKWNPNVSYLSVRGFNATDTLKGNRSRNHKISGCVVAPFTPFKDNGDINLDCLDRCADYFKRSHVNHLFVNGTISEGMSLTLTERKQIAEKWVKAAGEELGIILHIGTGNLRDSQELARHAKDIGVSSIAVVSPTYYKPASEEALVEYVGQVARAAPDLHLYYYCINFVTGVYLNTARFLELARDEIPNLCGLKLTSPELPHAQNCMAVNEKYQILFGTEDQFLPSLSLGMEVPITSPYLGPFFHKIKSAYDRGDMEKARQLQRQAQIFANVKSSHGGGIAVSKAVFSIITGIDAGPVRLPLCNLKKNNMEKLKQDIDALEIFK